jgi:hypothetical protein
VSCDRSQKGAKDGQHGEERAWQWRARHGFDVVAVESEDPAQVEHSSASFARLRAFRTARYNFWGRKNRRDQGNEERSSPVFISDATDVIALHVSA